MASSRKMAPKKFKEKGGKPQRPAPQKWFWYVAALVGVLLVVAQISNKQNQIVPYSQFKTDLAADRIAEVIFEGEWLRVKLKEPATGKILVQKVEDSALVPELERRGVRFESLSTSDWLSSFLLTWVLPFVFIFFLWQFLMGRAFKQGPPGLMSFGKSKARLVSPEKVKTTFKDVAGVDEAIEELKEVVDFLKQPARFQEIGGKIPKGVLLVGPPGTGKTLLARAIAGESSVAFFELSGSDFVEMFVGVGAARVRDLFQEAQKNAPCIVFIDELDAIAKSRAGGAGFQTNDEREQTLNQILVEMDGFDNHSGVIIMAATNRPEVLDPAILRPGRFDRQITVDRPNLVGREAILKVHAAKVKMEEGVDLRRIAARTPGFSGADLANIVNEAALLAVRKGQKTVTTDCLEDAIDRVVAGLARKNFVINEEEKRRIAFHEVGHALVAHYTPGSDPVHRISIVPRSSGALGFTMQVPDEERHLMTESEIRGRVRTLLAGRAAEFVVFGSVSSGAHDDLKRATQMLKRMITELGMGSSLGLMSLAQNRGFLQNPFVSDSSLPLSQETARALDEEVKSSLDLEYEAAKQLLMSKRNLLDVLATKLLQKETLEAEEFLVELDAKVPKSSDATA